MYHSYFIFSFLTTNFRFFPETLVSSGTWLKRIAAINLIPTSMSLPPLIRWFQHHQEGLIKRAFYDWPPRSLECTTVSVLKCYIFYRPAFRIFSFYFLGVLASRMQYSLGWEHRIFSFNALEGIAPSPRGWGLRTFGRLNEVCCFMHRSF